MRRRDARQAWLSLTPEPERELPRAVATLRCGGSAPADAVARERARAARLVLHGTRRAWLAWLHEALALAEREPAGDPEVAEARALVLDVISNHHALALGLAERTSHPVRNGAS